MRIELPQLVWHQRKCLELDLPEDWDVTLCPMRGAARAPLTLAQMEEAIATPLGSPRLSQIARGKKSAVIVFDDMTRPTRTYELAPIVLKELAQAGIRASDVTFVCALGAHGALGMDQFRKKLGPSIVENFRVFNHNPYEHCVHVGTTSLGTPVQINREVMEADIKIGIGCVTAHAQAGFSGGGKLLLPGVSHIDTISHYHLDAVSRAPETTGLGKHENNIMRRNIAEAEEMVGMDFKIDVLVNDRGATTEVFAGALPAVYSRALASAKKVYATHPRPRDMDLVIANAFAKANEMTIAIRVGLMALASRKGTLVVVADAPEGQVVHYLLGRFGRHYGGRQYPVSSVPRDLELIILAPHRDRSFADWFANPEVVTWTRSWEETMGLLTGRFGSGSRVAVLPSATMQYYDN